MRKQYLGYYITYFHFERYKYRAKAILKAKNDRIKELERKVDSLQGVMIKHMGDMVAELEETDPKTLGDGVKVDKELTDKMNKFYEEENSRLTLNEE